MTWFDRRRRDRAAVLMVVGLVLLGWESGSRLGLLNPLLFPAPSTVVATLGRLVASGEIMPHLRATLERLLLGVLIGCVPGCLLGLLMGWSQRLRSALDPVVAALHPLPKIALLPLIMVVFGIGEASKIVTVAVAAFFPMLLNAVAGVLQIDPGLFEAVKSYGGSRRKVFTRVVWPGSLPMVLTGLRISINTGLLITIAVELVAARTGMGTAIWLAWETMRTEEVYAGLVIIAALGVGLSSLLHRVSARLTPWHGRTGG